MNKTAVAAAVAAALGGVAVADAAIVDVKVVDTFNGATQGNVTGTTGTFTLDTVSGIVTGSGPLQLDFSLVGPGGVPGALFTRVIGDAVLGGGGLATGSGSYTCTNGVFPGLVNADFCANYNFGANSTNESTSSYGPGLAFAKDVMGDDVDLGDQQNIADFNGLVTTGTFGLGDLVTLDNRVLVPDGMGGMELSGEAVIFQVVPIPAAAWLFGSALGLLGWVRRKTL